MATFRFGLPASLGPRAAERSCAALRDGLSGALGVQLEPRVATTYAELGGWLLSGEVDLAWAPPLLCAAVAAGPGVRPLVITRGGRSTYLSAVAAAASALPRAQASWRAGWVDPHSVGGYLQPLLALRQAGADLAPLVSRPRFLGSYPAVLEALLAGEIDVGPGLVSGRAGLPPVGCWEELLGGRAAGLRVLALSPPVPNDGLAFSPRRDPLRAARLRAALLELASEPSAAPLLSAALEGDGLRSAPRAFYVEALAARDAVGSATEAASEAQAGLVM